MTLSSDSLGLRPSQAEVSAKDGEFDTQFQDEFPDLEIISGDVLDTECLIDFHILQLRINRESFRRFPDWERSGWAPDCLDNQVWRP